MKDLGGKTAVVTGAASGIGLALTRAFAAKGMNVVMADIEAERLADQAAQVGEQVEAVVCDVSDLASVEALRDAALDRFGAVHVVCNNAGVATGGPIWEHPMADWEWVLGVNLWGVIHGIHAFTPLLIEQGEGHIVNTASMAGLVSPPMSGIYNVTKHGVVTLSETLFADLRMADAEVGVSVLCPGWVSTQLSDAARNRPGAHDRPRSEAEEAMTAIVADFLAEGLAPSDVAELVVEAVREERFYVLTHPEWSRMVEARHDRIAGAADPSTEAFPA